MAQPKTMKVKLLKPCVISPGHIGKKGDVVEVRFYDAQLLIGCEKAEAFHGRAEEPKPEPEHKKK